MPSRPFLRASRRILQKREVMRTCDHGAQHGPKTQRPCTNMSLKEALLQCICNAHPQNTGILQTSDVWFPDPQNQSIKMSKASHAKLPKGLHGNAGHQQNLNNPDQHLLQPLVRCVISRDQSHVAMRPNLQVPPTGDGRRGSGRSAKTCMEQGVPTSDGLRLSSHCIQPNMVPSMHGYWFQRPSPWMWHKPGTPTENCGVWIQQK